MRKLLRGKSGNIYLDVSDKAKMIFYNGTFSLTAIDNTGFEFDIKDSAEDLQLAVDNGYSLCIKVGPETSVTSLSYSAGLTSHRNDNREFREKFGLKNSDVIEYDKAELYKQHMLILEEVEELEDAISDGKIDGVLDAVVDIMYLCHGLLNSSGLWMVYDEAWSRVHKSNMSKLGPEGKPIYREDGKVMKGPHYFPPRLEDIINRVTGD